MESVVYAEHNTEKLRVYKNIQYAIFKKSTENFDYLDIVVFSNIPLLKIDYKYSLEDYKNLGVCELVEDERYLIKAKIQSSNQLYNILNSPEIIFKDIKSVLVYSTKYHFNKLCYEDAEKFAKIVIDKFFKGDKNV